MRERMLGKCAKLILLTVVIVSGSAGTAAAETSNSAHYQVSETEFGTGSALQSCSNQYCVKASIGDMAAGTSKSAASTATFGSPAESDPLLEVIVDPGESNLGVLTTEKTAFKTSTVRVRNYMSEGYTMQVIGNSPKYNAHSLTTPNTPTMAHPGTEQFGINAVANTIPEVGANPQQVPSDQTSFGKVSDDYGIPNKFKYVSGDEIARSESESGRTDYTISMIVNVSNATPAGHYSGDFSVVVIPIY